MKNWQRKTNPYHLVFNLAFGLLTRHCSSFKNAKNTLQFHHYIVRDVTGNDSIFLCCINYHMKTMTKRFLINYILIIRNLDFILKEFQSS
jgi:hypothetical protein